MLPEPVPVRAHTVLCLLGYRGKGYSKGFVQRMTAVQEALEHDPATRVRLVTRPDDLCGACPHLDGGCTLGGREHEIHMRAHDGEVLRRLGLRAGAVRSWREVKALVARHLRGMDLPAICTTCPWLPLGWCAEGIDALRTALGADALRRA